MCTSTANYVVLDVLVGCLALAQAALLSKLVLLLVHFSHCILLMNAHEVHVLNQINNKHESSTYGLNSKKQYMKPVYCCSDSYVIASQDPQCRLDVRYLRYIWDLPILELLVHQRWKAGDDEVFRAILVLRLAHRMLFRDYKSAREKTT